MVHTLIVLYMSTANVSAKRTWRFSFTILPYYFTALIISKNFQILSSFNVNEMGSHWTLFLLYLNFVPRWPDDGGSLPKHVAKYNLAVIIVSCLDVCCVLTVHNILHKSDIHNAMTSLNFVSCFTFKDSGTIPLVTIQLHIVMLFNSAVSTAESAQQGMTSPERWSEWWNWIQRTYTLKILKLFNDDVSVTGVIQYEYGEWQTA